MKRVTLTTALALVLCFAASDRRATTSAAGAADQHSYFDALVSRADHWKSYSLRDPAQLDYKKNGGYAVSNSGDLWVTYDPAADTDAHKQDAAKVVVPAFEYSTNLAAPISAGASVMSVVSAGGGAVGLYFQGRPILIDREIVTVVSRSGNDIAITRGTHGTSPAAHSSGAEVSPSNNSLPNQVRLPLETTDGHSYLFTWDGYWTDSYVGSNLTNHKAFQFSSGGDSIWLEVRTRFDGGSKCCEPAGLFSRAVHVAAADMRSYNMVGGSANWSATDGNDLGPSATSKDPVQPKTGSFIIKPNTWTRFWVRIEQRANDYDYMDYWVADEANNPVQIHRRVPISVRYNKGIPNSIEKFWLEYNTSTDDFVRGDQRDLVSYFRNFVALRDVADVQQLLIRPAAGIPGGPSSVRGVRIFRGQ